MTHPPQMIAYGIWQVVPCVGCQEDIQPTSIVANAPWWLPECKGWACAVCYQKYGHDRLVEMGLGGAMQAGMAFGMSVEEA